MSLIWPSSFRNRKTPDPFDLPFFDTAENLREGFVIVSDLSAWTRFSQENLAIETDHLLSGVHIVHSYPEFAIALSDVESLISHPDFHSEILSHLCFSHSLVSFLVLFGR